MFCVLLYIWTPLLAIYGTFNAGMHTIECLATTYVPSKLILCVSLLTYRVCETVIDVEYPLIEGQLKAIDHQLERAISELNWSSEGRVR